MPDETPILEAARKTLGLNSLETAPPALPMWMERWWRNDGFGAAVPYTGQLLIPIGPQPDMRALQDSIDALVQRHEALRCRLAVRDGRFSVLVADERGPGPLQLTSVTRADLKNLRGASPVGDFFRQPFDLLEKPAIRFHAFADESGDVTLAVLVHHYFGDAWSAQVLRRELLALYAAAAKGEAAALPPVAQYSEYALAQRQALARNLPDHLTWWHERLAGAPPAKLPFDGPPDDSRRDRAHFAIPADVLAGLQAIAKSDRLSLAMICFAGFELALAQWCGQDDFVSVANSVDRIKAQFRDTVGAMMAGIPVRVQIKADMPIREFLRQVSKAFYDGIGRQDLSFEAYEEVFDPPAPFCTTRLNFLPRQKGFLGDEDPAMPVIEGVVPAPSTHKLACFRDLLVLMTEYKDGALGMITYTPAFSFETIRRFAQIYQRVLAQIAANPDATLGSL